MLFLTKKVSADDAVKAFIAQLEVPCKLPVNEVAITDPVTVSILAL